MTLKFPHLLLGTIAIVITACSAQEPLAPEATTLGADNAAPTTDAATREAPVVAGRPARVFIMAGVGKNCEPIAAPLITIDQPPAKGDVTFKPGQDTTLTATAQGTCVGAKATGTGIYYTARAGSSGTDRFSISAKLASGEISKRTFEVKIAE